MPSESKIIFLACFTIFISLFDVNYFMVSYPVIAKSLDTTLASVTIVNIVFLMSLVIGLPIAGKINDSINPKRTMIIGFTLLIFSGFLCSLSQTLHQLAFFRAFQGLASALLTISSTALIVIYIDIENRAKSFSYLGSAGALGLTLGSPIGGLISGNYNWHILFLSLIPLFFLALIANLWILPKSDKAIEFKSFISNFDFKGAFFITLGLLLFVYSMHLFIETHSYELKNIFTLLLSLLFISLFIHYELKLQNPLLNLRVFQNNFFSLLLIANLSAVVILSINNFIMPFYLTHKLNLLPQEIGFVMLSFSIFYGLVGLIVAKLTKIYDLYLLCFIGIFTIFLFSIYFTFQNDSASITQVIFLLIGYGTGFAFFIPPAYSLILNSATKENAGNITAIFQTARQLASLMGIVSIGLLIQNSQQVVHFHSIFLLQVLLSFISISFLIYIYYLKKMES